MQFQHTPGPWKVITNKVQGLEIKSSEKYGAVCCPARIFGDPLDAVYGPEVKANARLIAAAPSLLGLLQQAVARVELANKEGDPILSAWLVDAKTIIEKL